MIIKIRFTEFYRAKGGEYLKTYLVYGVHKRVVGCLFLIFFREDFKCMFHDDFEPLPEDLPTIFSD